MSRDRGKLGQGIGALKWGAGTPLRTMTFFLRPEMPDQQWHTVVALKLGISEALQALIKDFVCLVSVVKGSKYWSWDRLQSWT